MVMAALPFVGRHLELASLRETCAAHGAVVVVGAAGIGKSRLIAELSSDPSLTCVTAVGAPELQTSPYAVFRTLALQWERLLDPVSLGWSDNQLQNLSPLFPSLQSSDASVDGNAEERRQGLWLSSLRYLDALAASHAQPLVVVVEDLHAVDSSSLRLFGWLASQSLPISMIATSRPDAPTVVSQLPTIALRPLALAAIRSIQDQTSIAPVKAETLLELTGGVPLRIHEWVLGASLEGSAHAHGALLERVLQGCSPAAREALHLAAVFPGRIDSYLLAAVLDLSESGANDALSELASRGVMAHDRDGSWSFHHDSYRASLLDRLDVATRRSIERRLINGLRNQLGDRPELLTRIAAIATALGDDRIEAARLHLAAGQYAMSQLAPLAARDHFDAAVDLVEPTDNISLLLDATLSLGLVLATLSDSQTSRVLSKVYPLADGANNGDAFARAALAEPAGLGHIGTPMMTDHLVVARLRSALSRVQDHGLRARLITALAVHQHSSLSEHDYFSMLDDAEQIADGRTDSSLDSTILAARVGARRSLLATPAEDQVTASLQRLDPFDRDALPMVDLAVMLACRAGRLSTAEDLIRRYEEEFAPLPIVAQWSILRARTAIAFARGSVEVARTLSLEALQVTTDTRLDSVALEHFGFQIAAMLRERRKMAEARPTIETWVSEHPSYAAFRASRAWLYADLGDVSAARSDLEVFFAQDLVELRSRIEGPISIAMGLCAAFTIGGDDIGHWCEQGYQLLEPLANEWLLVGRGSLIEGPVVRVMALASSALGNVDRALAENDEAQRLAQASGSLLFVWHAIRDRGLILRNAGRFVEAATALRDAANRYRSAGLTQQADWLDGLAHAPPDTVTPDAGTGTSTSAQGEFRRDHKVWHVGLHDEAAICRHLKGMSMIASLLGSPGRQVAAGVLAAVGDDSSVQPEHVALRTESRQPVVDDQAVQAYRQRLDEIVTELDRADRRGDADLSERLSAEFEAITSELASTHGLGTRRRTMTTEDERARVRVNKAIRSAIRRIGEQAPGLAQHLERSIDTGLFCSYRPDPVHNVEWTLHQSS